MPVRLFFPLPALCVSVCVCGGASPGGEGGTGCRPIEFVSRQSQALTNSGCRTFFPAALSNVAFLSLRVVFSSSFSQRNRPSSGPMVKADFLCRPIWPTSGSAFFSLASLKSCVKDETAEITENVNFFSSLKAAELLLIGCARTELRQFLYKEKLEVPIEPIVPFLAASPLKCFQLRVFSRIYIYVHHFIRATEYRSGKNHKKCR